MKSIIRYFLFVSGFFFLASTMHAQELPGAAERAAKLTDWMKTNLKLTDDQVQKVKDINVKYANKLDELDASNATKDQKMQTFKANDAAKDAELKTVLTDDQYKTYLSKKAEIKKKFKQALKDNKQ